MRSTFLAFSALALVACGESSPTEVDPPATYEFASRFDPDASSVAYSGQVNRHALIIELKAFMDGLTDAIDGGSFQPSTEEVVLDSLGFYFDFDGESAATVPLTITHEPPLAQTTWGDLGSSAFLRGKTAGNDTSTDHVDWDVAFRGWSDTTLGGDGVDPTDSPTAFVEALFAEYAAQAVARGQGTPALGPDGEPLPVHVTPEGRDLSQLVQKFLFGAIAFHQSADDYLDDDVDGKGLLADNLEEAGDDYTALEHAWDEAFGYFGASRTYGDLTPEEVAGGPRGTDADGDGTVDLATEFIFGAARTVAQRDLGANVPTEFRQTAWDALRRGRAILEATDGTPDEEVLAALREQRDLVLGAWEAAYAATVVHYINETLQDMSAFGTDDYSFLDHAKHWSEAKGYAFTFQFNPRSPVSDGDFERLHGLLGDAPVLADAGETAIADYRMALLDARGILAAAFGFDAENLGDDDGLDGW